MTRPNPGDIMPFVSLSTAGVVNAGNPDLEPYFAEQIDLGLEWYFSEGAVLAGNFFQKNISGFTQRTNTLRPFSESGIPLEGITDPTLIALLPQGLNTILLFNQAQNIPGLTKIQGLELLLSAAARLPAQRPRCELQLHALDSGDRVVTGLAGEQLQRDRLLRDEPLRDAPVVQLPRRLHRVHDQLRIDVAGSAVARRSRIPRLQLERQLRDDRAEAHAEPRSAQPHRRGRVFVSGIRESREHPERAGQDDPARSARSVLRIQESW